MSSPDSMTFAGLAYDLQPAGATFSPAITITFTVPNARWGQQYVVRELDDATGRWTDLPTIYNPESGTISASVSHFCTIALFSSAVTQKPVAAAATMVEKPAPAAVPTPAPVTALGIFYNIVAFMTDLMLKNLVFILLIVIIIAAIYLRGRKGRLDRIRYNR